MGFFFHSNKQPVRLFGTLEYVEDATLNFGNAKKCYTILSPVYAANEHNEPVIISSRRKTIFKLSLVTYVVLGPVNVKVNPLKFRFMESLCHTAILK